MSHRERLILGIDIASHHRSERFNECDSFFATFTPNGFTVHCKKARLYHGVQSLKTSRIIRIAPLQPVNFRKRCITPAWAVQFTEFCYRNACLFNSTATNLITLFTRSHIFKHYCNVARFFMPVREVTMWFAYIKSVCYLVVELHFALVVAKRDSRRPTDGIWRCKFDND